MRGVRVSPAGIVLLLVAVASLAVMLGVDELAVPAGAVLGVTLVVLAADGRLMTGSEVPPGARRVEDRHDERPGPRRRRFAGSPPPASAEVAEEAWRRERRRRTV